MGRELAGRPDVPISRRAWWRHSGHVGGGGAEPTGMGTSTTVRSLLRRRGDQPCKVALIGRKGEEGVYTYDGYSFGGHDMR